MLWGKRFLRLAIVASLLIVWPGQTVSPVAADDFGLNVPASRLEPCPGEDPALCIHVKDGPPIVVSVSAGMTFEGWDGRQRIEGSGPASPTAAGLTVRRATAVSPPASAPAPVLQPAPVTDACAQESMVLSWIRTVSPDDIGLRLVDAEIPPGFTALTFDGQATPGGAHVFLIFGAPIQGLAIFQGTLRAVCGDAAVITLRGATQPGDQVVDFRVSPPARLK